MIFITYNPELPKKETKKHLSLASILLWLLGVLMHVNSVQAQRLPLLLSKSNSSPKPTPFQETVRYFDVAHNKHPQLRIQKDTTFYTLYFVLNDSLQELAVRLLSPLPELTSPNKGNIVRDGYYAFDKKNSQGFDGRICLDFSSTTEDSTQWTSIPLLIDKNNVPGNSTWRHYDRKLSPGTYRLRIFTTLPEKMRGAFMLETGSTPAPVRLQTWFNGEQQDW